MKNHFLQAVEDKRSTMFNDVVDHINQRLDGLRESITHDLRTKGRCIFDAIQGDYETGLLHQSKPETWQHEQRLKDQVRALIDSCDAEFARLGPGQPTPTPPPGGNSIMGLLSDPVIKEESMEWEAWE
jgi:hypothetical protein